jgi:four helix bundle protein
MEKRYDLEERTEKFTKNVISLCKKIPKNTINIELVSQLVRSSGSVGANYIEANEAISQKDLNFRIRICRKEAKETRYWIKLLVAANAEIEKETDGLIQ